ncbi:hypothetical protein BB560_002922 [Smittium megazygosporum]|uniref:Sensor domain-containing protein n=1 Tax=Smittium megazygosporum TaxID=133381 RepID=A0A2T9ZDE5_9FUNG|nr:hypothetical protein BB560_002922 [Smittium megazygosporum]
MDPHQITVSKVSDISIYSAETKQNRSSVSKDDPHSKRSKDSVLDMEYDEKCSLPRYSSHIPRYPSIRDSTNADDTVIRNLPEPPASNNPDYSYPVCKHSTSYFAPALDLNAWISACFQIVSFLASMFYLMMASMLFSVALMAVIIFPIGPTIAYYCLKGIKYFGYWELNSLHMTRTTVEKCPNCNPYIPKERFYPTFTEIKADSYFGRMFAIWGDAFVWKSIVYFLFVKPIVATASFSIFVTAFLPGLLIFPILPAIMTITQKLSIFQRKVGLSQLTPK